MRYPKAMRYLSGSHQNAIDVNGDVGSLVIVLLINICPSNITRLITLV